MNLTIRHKLLLLTLLTSGLSLLFAGVMLDYFIKDLHHEQARKHIAQGFQNLQGRLSDMHGELMHNANLLADDERLSASLYLVNHYQDPVDYQASLFDEEKKAISLELLQTLKRGDASHAMVLDNHGQLVAFADKHGTGLRLGFTSYDHEKPVFYTRTPSQSRWQQAEQPERITENLQHIQGIDTGTPTGGYLHSPTYLSQFAIAQIKGSAQMDRQQDNGTLLLMRHLDTDVITELSMESGLALALTGSHGNALLDPDKITERRPVTTTNIPSVFSGADAKATWADNRQYFLGIRKLTLHNGQPLFIQAGVSKSRLANEVSRTHLVVFSMLLISALLVIPASLVFARRSLTEPLARLIDNANAYRRGEYRIGGEPDTHDEIGELGRAMSEMAQTIRDREQELVAVIENLPLMVFLKDARTLRFVRLNKAGEKLLGMSREEVIGKTDYDLFPKEQADFFTRKDRETLILGTQSSVRDEPVDTRKGRRYLHTRKMGIYRDDRTPHYLLGISDDITERRSDEERLRLAAAVFDNTSEAIVITDKDTNIIAVNQAYIAITGYSEDEIIGSRPSLIKSNQHGKDFYQAMWDAIKGHDHWQGEIWNRRKNGTVFPVWQNISAVKDNKGRLTHYVGVFSDITPIKEAQDRLDYLAHHDPLTNLPNRLLLSDRLDHALQTARRERQKLAVIFIDLDRFKHINDSLGHPVGDEVLKTVAFRLTERLRESDTLSRQGGDEFILIVENITDESHITDLAHDLLQILRQPVIVNQQEMHISGSIGISLYPDDGVDSVTLIRNADSAMYRAKERGRDQFRFYTEELTHAASERIEMENALRRAVENGEFRLNYQPQIDLASGAIIGAEALISWQHPQKGLIPPARFIHLAEETGVIIEMGNWVIDSACRQLRQWRDNGKRLQHIAVNVSSVQVHGDNLLATVRQAMQDHQLSPGSLEIEVTEAVFLQDTQHSTEVLNELHLAGAMLSVDDFGTGYSSLGYLKRFPVDRLKIDRSFIHDMLEDPNDWAIARSIIALGHSLGLEVVAEGIEQAQQAEMLAGEGCDIGQGYHFHRALDANALEALLTDVS